MRLNFKLFSRFYYSIGLLLLILVLGTLGYMIVMDWGLIDSFYMTIITLSTVGFGEVHGLTESGRLFTSFLIITSFGIFAYAISAITTYLVGGEYKVFLKEYKTVKQVEKLKNHTLICGYGRVGRQASADLKFHNKQFIILESNSEKINKYHKDEPEIPFIEGDATNDDALLKAGIDRAGALIAALPNDSDNLYVVLTAREMNPNLKIIARASNHFSVKKLRIAGADHVIMPDKVGGEYMASFVINPDVIEFLNQIKMQGQASGNLEEIAFDDLPENFHYKTIEQIKDKEIIGCNIIGYKSPEGEFIINPPINTEIIPNSKLFVLGSPKQIKKLNIMFGIQNEK